MVSELISRSGKAYILEETARPVSNLHLVDMQFMSWLTTRHPLDRIYPQTQALISCGKTGSCCHPRFGRETKFLEKNRIFCQCTHDRLVLSTSQVVDYNFWLVQ
jgi:hypothetical protein